MPSYNFRRTLIKGLRALVVFGLPFLINYFFIEFPQIAQLTIGVLLLMVADWLKRWVGLKLP